MVEAQRELLNSLMGVNRDGDRPDLEIKDFRDSRVCKNYLCGLCPHDLFSNTKIDLGECDKAHDEDLKAKYDEERQSREFGYELDWERMLNRYISDCERKIQRAQNRLEEEDGAAAPVLDVENNAKVLEITSEIQETLKKAEDAGEEGEVDLSVELMAKVEQLQKKKAELQALAMLGKEKEKNADGDTEGQPQKRMNMNVNQKLRVCDVCGAFLSIYDSDSRLADHFGGKLHLGYLRIRQCLKELQENRKKKVEERAQEAERRSKDRSSSRRRRSRSRDRSPHRSRDRDRDRGRERDRDRRDRRRDRDRRDGRDRRDDRGYYGDKDYHRHKDRRRYRSRSRSQDRRSRRS